MSEYLEDSERPSLTPDDLGSSAQETEQKDPDQDRERVAYRLNNLGQRIHTGEITEFPDGPEPPDQVLRVPRDPEGPSAVAILGDEFSETEKLFLFMVRGIKEDFLRQNPDAQLDENEVIVQSRAALADLTWPRDDAEMDRLTEIRLRYYHQHLASLLLGEQPCQN